MPTMDVFRNSEIVDTTMFQRQLMILEDFEGNLRWETDDDLRKKGTGSIRIWALCEFEGSYSIRFVLPTWTLTIDGTAYEHKLHEDVKLNGRQVELEFQDYRFEFH